MYQLVACTNTTSTTNNRKRECLHLLLGGEIGSVGEFPMKHDRFGLADVGAKTDQNFAKNELVRFNRFFLRFFSVLGPS